MVGSEQVTEFDILYIDFWSFICFYWRSSVLHRIFETRDFKHTKRGESLWEIYEYMTMVLYRIK